MGQIMEKPVLTPLHCAHLRCKANQADFQILTLDSYAANAMEGNAGLGPSLNGNVATSWCQHQSYINCHNVLILIGIHMYTRSLPSTK